MNAKAREGLVRRVVGAIAAGSADIGADLFTEDIEGEPDHEERNLKRKARGPRPCR